MTRKTVWYCPCLPVWWAGVRRSNKKFMNKWCLVLLQRWALVDGQQFTLTINIFSRQIVVVSGGRVFYVTIADVAIDIGHIQ